VRILRFRPKVQSDVAARETTVAYFFHTNGKFATTRNEVRWEQLNPFQRYAYYAKIEVAFGDLPVDEAPAAVAALMERVLPILLRDHFDWEAVAAGAARAGQSVKE
jgi:hypothetical protein